MNKPLCLELEEAERELNTAIENISRVHGLPCYLLEPIVSRLLVTLQSGKRREIEEAKNAFEASKEEQADG